MAESQEDYPLDVNERRQWKVGLKLNIHKTKIMASGPISSIQSLSCIRLFATPWTTVCHPSLSITNSWSPHKPMSIESVIASNHLILCHPLLLLPSIFPSIRVFSNESALCIRWPKYWSFNFSISPSRLCGSPCSPRDSQPTVQKHQFFSTQIYL